MTALANWLLGLCALAVLACYGGSCAFSRPGMGSAVVAALVLAAIGMGRRFRRPRLGWVLLALAPATAIACIQAVRVGWSHPWVAPDLAALGVAPGTWSIDPDATWKSMAWSIALAGFALVLHCHFRGERARALGIALVVVAIAHAVAALVLALCGADWPVADGAFRARGAFIYPNHAAAFSACCLPLAILIARDRGGHWWWIGVGVLALALVLSASRGGILVACAINLPLAWRVLPRRRRALWFAALLVGIASYLAVIGLREVGDKFGKLLGPEGVTLSGRITIWKNSLPLLAEASPLGSGVGTAEQAYWRTGDSSFQGHTVNHLHSDPLEWYLEFGWAGCACIAAGLLAFAWRLRPPLPAPESGGGGSRSPHDGVLFWGGCLGILHLLLHSCCDFIWNREAIAMAAVVLAILAVEGRSDHRVIEPSSSARLRWSFIVLACVLAAVIPRTWRGDAEGKLARDASEFIEQRRHAGTAASGVVIDELFAARATTVRLAVVQARAALDLPGEASAQAVRLDQGRQALIVAAAVAPGDAGAWVERARMAARAGNDADQALSTAIARVMTWAPAWPYGQMKVLDCLRRGGMGILPPEQLRALVSRLLTIDQPQPGWFFTCAQAVLGRDSVEKALAVGGDRLASSGMWWLAQKAASDVWLARYLELSPAALVIDPSLALLVPVLSDPKWPAHPKVDMRVGGDAESRRDQADQLLAVGLPMPIELSHALERDGAPWNLWEKPFDPLDAATRERLRSGLSADLYRPWARGWFDRLALVEDALAGRTIAVNLVSDPALTERLIDAGTAPTSGERTRLSALLHARARPEWRRLGAGCSWTWLWLDGGPSRVIGRTPIWRGLVVDGVWKGWVRGDIVTDGVAPGLHRIALLELP